jgi:hypothetical protein
MPSSWQSCPRVIGCGDARGEPRGDRGPAPPDHRRGREIGAQHAHQVDAIRRLLGSRILWPAQRAIVETPPARELD